MSEEQTELNYRRQISRQHLDILAEYMERYPSLAMASARSREGHLQSRRMWEKIARTLNKIDVAVTKSGPSWARYWIDLKFKIRRKFTVIKRCQNEGSHCSMTLNPLEQRLAKILSDEEGNLLPTSSAYHQMKFGHKTNSKFNRDPRLKPRPVTKDKKPEKEEEAVDDYLIVNNLTPEIQEVKPIIKLDSPITDPIHIIVPGEERKSIEDMQWESAEFELRKQKELFEMDKKHRKEKHEMEIAILRLQKQILVKQLKKA